MRSLTWNALGCLFFLWSLCLMCTGSPTDVAVSHCITWFQTQLILTTCQIRYHSHFWDHCRSGQLCTLIPRGGFEYHTVGRLCELILAGTKKNNSLRFEVDIVSRSQLMPLQPAS